MSQRSARLQRLLPIAAAVLATVAGVVVTPAEASSHREAPLIKTQPKVDATDFHMFIGHAAGRSAFVTMMANACP